MTNAPRKQRGLTREDRALWQIVTEKAEPLVNHARVTGHEHLELEAALDELAKADKSEQAARGSGAQRKSDSGSAMRERGQEAGHRLRRTDTSAVPGSTPARSEVRLAMFEEKVARRLRTGRMSIDARLDLHGLRQDEAHHALRGFLLGAASRGCRCVLVITGKGARSSSAFSEYQQAERGVLRRQVPVWLSTPDLARVVISYMPAHERHGGDGALYVRLRSRAKRGS